MKIKHLLIFLLAFVFLTSCELGKDNNLETLISYLEKINRADLAKIIKGTNFRAEIVYQDEKGNYYPLTLNSCYNGFVDAGYNKKFSYQLCQYLLYTALKKVLEKRTNQLEPQVKALIEDYRNYMKEKEKTLETIKKITLYSIPIFFAFTGLIIGIGAYKLMNLKEKEEKLNQKILEVETGIKHYQQEKEEEARKIISDARKEASRIIEKAQEEAEYIKMQAYEKGYEEGQKRHKKELKSLRIRISAIKSIFKIRPELNDCFKKITGWDFEKWLKER